MKKTAELVTLELPKDLPAVEKQQTKAASSNIGTFLRMILICVLLTGSIAIFICWHFSGKIDNPARIVLDDVLKSSKAPQAGNTIFFHKSNPYIGSDYSRFKILNSLSRHPEAFRMQLSPHEVCAIESAALHNPNQQVFVLYESPVSWVRNSKLGLIATLRNISNVNLRSLDLRRYVTNSPFENLIKPMEGHRFVWSKVSQYLGFLSLWRYGGTYLGLDTITLRNFDDLGANFAVVDNETQQLSANVFNFAPMGTGFHVVKNLAYRIAKILKAPCDVDDVADSKAVARELLTDIFQRVCLTKDFEKMQDRMQCFGLKVYNQEQIYGVPSNANAAQQEAVAQRILDNRDNLYATYDWEYFKGEKSSDKIFSGPYASLAEGNCPRTYAYVRLYEKYIYGFFNEDTKNESNQEESKQEESNQEESKQEESKQEESKQEESKQEESKQEESKQEESKQEEESNEVE